MDGPGVAARDHWAICAGSQTLDLGATPVTAPLLDHLRFILGRWRSSGTVLDENGNEAVAIAGTDEYELMDGGQWIIHRVDVMMGDQRTVALELIGQPDQGGRFRMRAFDGSGAYDEMTLEQRPDGAWRLEGDGVRSTLRAQDEQVMTTLWERCIDGSWIDWMKMRFDRNPLDGLTALASRLQGSQAIVVLAGNGADF
jgi:hypothetical protein